MTGGGKEKCQSSCGFFIVEPCTSSNGIEIKLQDRKIDLKKVGAVLPSVGDSQVVMLTKFQGYAVSIYASGRMMVKGSGAKKIGAKTGTRIARELVVLLEGAIY